MTLSVTIYFSVHCGHTGSPDWGDVPQGLLWVESRPRRLRPCGLVRSCGPVPFAVTACDYVMYLRSISFLYGFKYGSNCSNDSMPGTILGGSLSFINMKSAPCSIYIVLRTKQLSKYNVYSSSQCHHSLVNRHICSTSAETRDRKCFSMQLILVVSKMDMINQIWQMLTFC